MEELKSTEVLEREILEDARKKALRILKQSEEIIRGQNAEWKRKLTENIENLGKKYKEEIKTESERVMSRLPVDKQRIKIKKIENMLRSTVENWYKNLNRSQILELLREKLRKINEHLAINENLKEKNEDGKWKTAGISGLEKEEAEAILSGFNLMCVIKEIPSDNCYPSIVIDTDDVRITASIENMIDSILDEKRSELAEALIGRDFLGEE